MGGRLKASLCNIACERRETETGWRGLGGVIREEAPCYVVYAWRAPNTHNEGTLCTLCPQRFECLIFYLNSGILQIILTRRTSAFPNSFIYSFGELGGEILWMTGWRDEWINPMWECVCVHSLSMSASCRQLASYTFAGAILHIKVSGKWRKKTPTHSQKHPRTYKKNKKKRVLRSG